MKVAKIAVSVFNKHQNRTFSELCNKYGIKHISTSKITLPTYMMLIITSDNITAVPKSSRTGAYGAETYYGCSVYTLNEFKENVNHLISRD